MQDNQFYQNRFNNIQNNNNQQPVSSEMSYMQRPPGREGRPPMRGNQPRPSGPPFAPPSTPPFTPPFTPPPPPPFAPPTEEGGPPPAPPRSAPPSFSPQISPRPGGARGIRNCLFRNTFIWLTNGNSFWFFPTFVGRRAVSGFRWRGFAWTFQRIDLDRIRSFQCF